MIKNIDIKITGTISNADSLSQDVLTLEKIIQFHNEVANRVISEMSNRISMDIERMLTIPEDVWKKYSFSDPNEEMIMRDLDETICGIANLGQQPKQEQKPRHSWICMVSPITHRLGVKMFNGDCI